MNKLNVNVIAMSVAVILAAGMMVIPLSASMANADTMCKFTNANQRCDLDIQRLNGPFKLSIINEVSQNQTNNGGGGSGGGNVSTVDQEARNAIQANDAADAQLGVKVDGIASNVTVAQNTIGVLMQEVQDLRGDLQKLNQSVITGISLSNGSVPTVPPVDNGTGGPIDNGTGPVEPPVDNGTGPVEPPIDNGTGPAEPPIDNGTGGIDTNSTG